MPPPDRSPNPLAFPDIEVTRGVPLPLGATPLRDGVNFAVFSRHATDVILVLSAPGQPSQTREIPLSGRFNRTGEIWHAFIRGIDPGVHYGYRMDRKGPPSPLHRFNPRVVLLDPAAKAISGCLEWGDRQADLLNHRRSIVLAGGFDWGDDQPLNIPLADSVIYELHVRGFTRHPSSQTASPGTFAGLIEKIPYLQHLGATAVELLPVHEFEEFDADRLDPATGEPLVNFWGYQPISFSAPNSAYCSRREDGSQVHEFKQLVKSFHQAGIEVILDVVFNHTAEGDGRGQTISFRGIDNAVYYMLDPQSGEYLNYSGCGNTLNCNHPVVRDLIVESLRYWVMEMHVDGFRFDLASILGRGQDGAVLNNPPLLESLALDPVLAETKLIAEAWDAAGLYQVGTFPAWSRWAEWNGKFRDEIRRFVRGEPGMVSALATRLVGSPDLYQTSRREPYHSINFVTCHDGFTLADLVSYDRKHNEPNGENNKDGADVNWSWNCGVEGPTADAQILSLRTRQIKNCAALLLLADGVPMVLAGDEMGRTQLGNNNAFCQDNPVSWIDWDLLTQNAGLHRFFRLLIAFRRQHPLLRSASYASLEGLGERKLTWHGVKLGEPDWSWESRSLAMQLSGVSPSGDEDQVFLIANAHWESHDFELPRTGLSWRCFLDTMRDSPDDVTELGAETALANAGSYSVGPRSCVVLIGRSRT